MSAPIPETDPTLFRGPVWNIEAAARAVGRSKSWLRFILAARLATASVPVGGTTRHMFSQDDLDALRALVHQRDTTPPPPGRP